MLSDPNNKYSNQPTSGPFSLTPRQAKWIKAYIATGNGTEATLQSYDVKNRKSAGSLSKQVKKMKNVQKALAYEMQKQGLTAEVIVDSLKTNIVTGTGIRSTAADSNRSIELWAKLTGAFTNPISSKSYKETVQELPHKTLIEEVERRKYSAERLLSDIKNETIVVESTTP